MLTAPPKKQVSDPGSDLGGWKNKCLMNAVLSCVSGDMFEYARELFLESCANNAGSGVCGGAAEAKNFEMVRRALRECGMCVRIWGLQFIASLP